MLLTPTSRVELKAAIFGAKFPDFHDYLQHLFRYILKFSNILLNLRTQKITKIFLLSSNCAEKTPVIIKVLMPTSFAMYHTFFIRQVYSLLGEKHK